MVTEKVPGEIESLVKSISKTSYAKVSVNLSKTAIGGVDKLAKLLNKSRTEVMESLILTTLPSYADMVQNSIIKARGTEYYLKNKKMLDQILKDIPKIRAELFT
jgi:hypothetical protein